MFDAIHAPSEVEGRSDVEDRSDVKPWQGVGGPAAIQIMRAGGW
jgi:hypothetical protein